MSLILSESVVLVMYSDNPEFQCWGLSGPDDLPLSWGYERGVRGVRVSDAAFERQTELYGAALDAARVAVRATRARHQTTVNVPALSAEPIPDTVTEVFDQSQDAPTSPAPEGAGSLSIGKTVELSTATAS